MTAPFEHIDPQRLRSGWGVKWGLPDEGVLAAWVADMDFGIPPAVQQALSETVARQDFGYPFWPDGDPVVAAFEQRMHRAYGWQPQADRTKLFSDLIQALQVMIELTTAPGDGVAVHVPCYPPFLAAIERAGRRIVPIPMERPDPDGDWQFDPDGLGEKLRSAGCTLLVVVNPHNPTGRMFTRAELQTLAGVAEELDLTVWSDEIHADLSYDGREHVPFASLSPDAASRTVTSTSATKAFNLAAIRCAVTHVGSDRVWERLETAPLDYFGTPSSLSRVATVAAWQHSADWLAGLRNVLHRNRATVANWAATVPGLRYRSPEATYLAWFDLNGSAPAGPDPAARILRDARVFLSDGAEFSQHTAVDTGRFVRLNFATSPANLAQILDRLGSVLGGPT